MQWRLLLDGPASGAWNMAVDEAILTLHGRGLVPPTLRFYSWDPACLSLGRLQSLESIPWLQSGDHEWLRSSQDLTSLEEFPSAEGGATVVRRPTGGRAVWHQHEITYLAAPRLDLLPRGETSVMAAYRLLSGGLNAGLCDLGVPVALARGGTREGNANCFVASAACDSAVDGKKLIGAAQFRQGGALLQHGSILTDIDREAWGAVLPGSMEVAVSLASLGVHLAPSAVIGALAEAFARTLGVTLLPGELTAEERLLANQLQCLKYGARDWTMDGGLRRRTPERDSTHQEPSPGPPPQVHTGVCSAVMAEV